jgi:hypothetical protein
MSSFFQQKGEPSSLTCAHAGQHRKRVGAGGKGVPRASAVAFHAAVHAMRVATKFGGEGVGGVRGGWGGGGRTRRISQDEGQRGPSAP